MAFYYLKAGGTATGDGGRTTTARTGTWSVTASEYYDTMATLLAATTAPTSGDLILWSDDSSDTLTGDYVGLIPVGVGILTVDNDNQDQYAQARSDGPLIDNASGNKWIYEMGGTGNVASLNQGVNIKQGDPFGSGDAIVRFEQLVYNHDVRLEWNSTSSLGNYFSQSNQGSIGFWHNFEFAGYTTSGDKWMDLGYGSNHVFIGGSISNTSRAFRHRNGPSYLYVYGMDMSGMASGSDIVELSGGQGGTFTFFYRCDFPTNWTLNNFTEGPQHACIIECCDSEYQYEVHQGNLGEVNMVTTHHHADDDTFDDGSTKGSYKFMPSSNVSYTNPIFMGTPQRPRWLLKENDNAATNGKVRIKFASATADTLTSKSLWVYVCYPDSTTAHLWKTVRHQVSPIDSGATLSTQTSKWTGTGTDNQYYLDITMTSPGDGMVGVMVGVTEDKDIYLSPQIEFVA